MKKNKQTNKSFSLLHAFNSVDQWQSFLYFPCGCG